MRPTARWWTTGANGKSVKPARQWKPDLYIACGISGASHHLEGRDVGW